MMLFKIGFILFAAGGLLTMEALMSNRKIEYARFCVQILMVGGFAIIVGMVLQTN